jgi:hypothetical protein
MICHFAAGDINVGLAPSSGTLHQFTRFGDAAMSARVIIRKPHRYNIPPVTSTLGV